MQDLALARELLLAELRKEKGRFITQRIIDRLCIFHATRFDDGFLAGLAEEINRELAGRTAGAGRSGGGS